MPAGSSALIVPFVVVRRISSEAESPSAVVSSTLPFVVVSDNGPETFDACTVPFDVRAVTPEVIPSICTEPSVVRASTTTFAGISATKSADASLPRRKRLNIVRKLLV